MARDHSSHPTVGALSAEQVVRVQVSLAHALESPSSLDDSARVDAIRALEQLVCTATAAQAALTAELDDSIRESRAARGMPSARQGVGVAAQVALARRTSPHRGQRLLGLATMARRELPHAWAAWSGGHVTEWRVTCLARETACLDLDDRLEIDRLLAANPAEFEAMSDRELIQACQREAARLDPAAVVRRRRNAEADRHVSLRPAPDTMTWLTGLLPVKDGVAVLAELTRCADVARGQGDDRTKGQVMADTLVDRVLGRSNAASTPPPFEGTAARVELGLVMTDQSLFGNSDTPAHVQGYGPIPAELAREIVAGACSADDHVWLRRLYTDPTTGQLMHMDARGRLFRGSLARFIRLRDQICRTPWCSAPIRHTDHAHSHAAGGQTSAANGQGLCESCNFAKAADGWDATPRPDGSIVTTTPTGHEYATRPPPLIRILEHNPAPIAIDYVLAS